MYHDNDNTSYFDIQQLVSGVYRIKPLPVELNNIKTLFSCLHEFMQIVTELINKDETEGIIYSPPITSIDYQALYQAAENTGEFHRQLSALVLSSTIFQTARKPIIGVMDTNCFGPVLSTMLWASYRIALDNIEIGFAEPTYGLFPGFGATIVTTRLLGPEKAIPLLTQGTTYTALEAYQLGIINRLVSALEDPIAIAIDCIASYSEIVKDQIASRGRRSLETDEEQLEQASALIVRRTNKLIPGINACIEVVKDSLGLPIKEALLQEALAYSKVWSTDEALAMIRTRYMGINETMINSQDPSNYKAKKIGVIGAGMMGSGIAYQAAKSGISVVLKDIDEQQAQQGKEYAQKKASRLVQQGQLSQQQLKELLARIHPTVRYEDFNDADVIIEAVFEDKELKAEVTRACESYLVPSGVFASNTTSLPINALSTALEQPENFLGMHFFSPVDRMPLVEIIRGKHTSKQTLNKALQLAYQLEKIPIVVFDGPAFFTSRIFFNYILEAITMLLEGIPAQQVEKSARAIGFAVGPLAVLDEISVSLMLHVYKQLPRLHASQLRCYAYLEKLIEQGRNGRKSGRGLYDYDESLASKTIWQDPSLPVSPSAYTEDTIKMRLLHVMSLDSYRCIEEGVLNRTIDGDIGSILGIGYPVHTGGVFSHIDQIGLSVFVEQCQSLSSLGQQWEVPDSLVRLAEKKFNFYSKFDANWPLEE